MHGVVSKHIMCLTGRGLVCKKPPSWNDNWMRKKCQILNDEKPASLDRHQSELPLAPPQTQQICHLVALVAVKHLSGQRSSSRLIVLFIDWEIDCLI